jgi:hypothetical protein
LIGTNGTYWRPICNRRKEGQSDTITPT